LRFKRTSTAIKFKCKSWIDTFGQRSAKAGGSLITNQFATSIVDLTKCVSNNLSTLLDVGMLINLSLRFVSLLFSSLPLFYSYGSAAGVLISLALLWISDYMGKLVSIFFTL
jgi:hypothetical protein